MLDMYGNPVGANISDTAAHVELVKLDLQVFSG